MHDWFPNWKNEEEYPNNDATPHEWAWEFLRRNAEYQQDYISLYRYLNEIGYFQEVRQLPSRPTTDNDKTFVPECVILGTKALLAITDKYKVVGFSQELPNPALSSHTQSFSFLTERPRVYDRNQYWVDGEDISNNILDQDGIAQMIELMDRCEYEKNEEKILNTTIRARDLVISISLTGNIKEQIDLVSQLARAQQKQLAAWGIFKEPRNRPDDFRLYLRLLDALEAGVEEKKIGEIFWPDDVEGPNRVRSRKAEQAIKRAQEHRDFDYIRISTIPTH
jgi:hypothetical protein